ncbi:LysM peptidoglycan-binding domain-containing protein, partial [Streptococcus didelphis]
MQSGAILAEEINIKKEIDSYVLGTEADVILNEMLINEEDDKFINDSYEELKNKVELSEKIVNKEVVDKQGDSNVKVENTIDDVKIEHNSKDDVNEVKKYNQSDDSKEKVSSGNDSVDTLEGNTSSKMRMKRSLDVMEPLIPNFEDSINYYLSSLTVDEVNALKNAKSFEERSVLLERILNKKIDEQYALGELDDLKKQLTDEELRDLYEGDSTQAFESKLKKIYFDYQQSLNLQELIDELIVLSTEDEYNQLLNAKSEEDLAETIESLSIKKSQELSNQSSTSRRRKRFAPALVFPVIAYGPQIVAAAVATGKVIAAAAAVGVAAYGAHQAYNHYKVSHSQAKSNAVQRQHTRAQNASRSRERSRARQQAQTQARNYSKTPAGHSAVSQLASNGSYYGNTYNRLGQVAANLFYSYGSQLIPSYNLTGTKHQVLPNESVWSISNQYGISMTDLIAWNGIQNNLIHPGQQLLVRPDTISEDGTKHQVLPNESVWSISNQYGISMTDLIAWNGIQNNLIHPGQQLFIRPTNITNSRTKDKIYKVQSGDSVWKIAHENGITMDDLIRWNDIRNNTIHPGQQLIVKPGTKTPINTPEAPIKDKIYKVQSGDSVWKIAHENGITMDDLIRWNDIRNNTIHPGQQLIIKPGTKTPINTPEAPIKDKIYKVQSGDSVWKIAHENGITMDDLIRWNDIRNNTIHPGQQLIIKPGTK